MRLRKLEIAGFKSFRDKVILDFPAGISGVVGPNGCGKSNIADAIRWVMGEQRVKSLRGKKMDDVIFNGSEEASPVGMAEVSMTLEANGRRFPGEFAEFSEVTVSRKIFREGESEYYLNKVPCRLLDVKEFFMGTGVGARTYALVEQNSVSTLVEAKPEDRRQFIEEAAGISKYKSRKESAVRKMDQTKENLLRLNDIIREVKSQLNAISKQAKRAEQYKKLKAQLKDAEWALALQAYSDFSLDKRQRDLTLNACRAREMELRTGLEAAEAAWEELRAQCLENEELISSRQEELYRTKNAIGIKEQAIRFSQDKVTDLTQRSSKDAAETEQLEKRRVEIEAELSALRQTTDETDGKIAELGDLVQESQQHLEEVRTLERSLRQETENQKNAYFNCVTEKSRQKNLLTTIQHGIEDIHRRDEREKRELEEHVRRVTQLSQSLEELQVGLAKDEQEAAELKERQRDTASEAARARDELRETDEEIATLKEERGAKASRLQSLKEFQEDYSFCSEGVKSLMKSERTELTKEAFYGLVAEHIDVPEQYETAVEAVLGEKLQYVVVKSQEDGVQAIDYMKNYSLGRGSFVPLEVRNQSQSYRPGEYEHLREAVPLIEQVHIRDGFESIAHYLLGDVLLIPSLLSGVSLWRQNGFRGTFVTPEGDIITPHGVLTGGSGVGGERSVLRNKREIGELETACTELAHRLDEALEKKKQTQSLIAQWDEETTRARAELVRFELQINGKRKDLERFADEKRRTEQRLGVLEFNRETLRAEEDDARGRITKIEAEIVALEERERELDEKIALVRGQEEELKGELEKREGDLTSRKVLLASLEEKRESHSKTLNFLETSRERMTQEIAAKTEDIEACGRETAELTAQMAAEREALSALYEELKSAETVLDEKKNLQEEREQLLRTKEQEGREIKHVLEQVVKDIGEGELQCREAEMQMENLCRRMEEKYAAELAPALDEFERLDDTQVAEFTAILEKSRKDVDEFGEVNLMALSE
ncbi:MAG: chromosome segregation protein SMC, partial [Smithellaceae bacterium]|nr:chromosome segregation protein SMC [Smithellaceae bacterium]